MSRADTPRDAHPAGGAPAPDAAARATPSAPRPPTHPAGRVHRGRISIVWHPRAVAVGGLVLAVTAGLAVAVMGQGTIPLSPGDILAALIGDAPARDVTVVRGIRLPRVVTAAAVGCALGVSGALFQSVSRNPLGSPDVIGFTSGAAAGAAAQIVMLGGGVIATPAAAVLGGAVTATLVYLLSRHRGVTGGYRIVLVGIDVGALMDATTRIILVRGDIDRSVSAEVWLSGSLASRSWADTAVVAAGLAVAWPLALALARPLALVEMGDVTARQLGVHVEATRASAMLAGVVLTATAVAAAGPIAFVALAAPQIASRLAGSSGPPLVTAGLTGAALLIGSDLLALHLPAGARVPIGVVTGLLGGVYLLWLLTRGMRR